MRGGDRRSEQAFEESAGRCGQRPNSDAGRSGGEAKGGDGLPRRRLVILLKDSSARHRNGLKSDHTFGAFLIATGAGKPAFPSLFYF
jgi:hypothetical protein